MSLAPTDDNYFIRMTQAADNNLQFTIYISLSRQRNEKAF